MQKLLILLLFIACSLFSFSGYQDISPAKLQELKNQGTIIIDIRTKGERDESGVIPGSILITSHTDTGFDVKKFEKDLKLHDIRQNFVLVCRSGNRSKEVANALAADGYSNFYNLKYGIKSWLAEKRPTVMF